MIDYFNLFFLFLPLLFWFSFNIGWKLFKDKILTHKFYQTLKNIYGKNYYFFVYAIDWLLEFWIIFYYLIYFFINNSLINLSLVLDFKLSWKIPIFFILLLFFNWSFTSFIVFQAFYGYSSSNQYQYVYKTVNKLDFWMTKLKVVSRFVFLYLVIITISSMLLPYTFFIYLIASGVYLLINIFLDPEGGRLIEVIMRSLINSIIYFLAFLILHNILLILFLAVITKFGILRFLKYKKI